jgi:hypothetical protein
LAEDEWVGDLGVLTPEAISTSTSRGVTDAAATPELDARTVTMA